ncbi:unnamed protein product [Peniophora sp. CBMAI 1063]|nr:unnamed protein product [Peniophora sp. CBMAI 1063]
MSRCSCAPSCNAHSEVDSNRRHSSTGQYQLICTAIPPLRLTIIERETVVSDTTAAHSGLRKPPHVVSGFFRRC